MKNIGVEVAPEHSYGRAFLEGVASYTAKHTDWRLVSLTQETISHKTISKLDGLILRLFGDTVEQLSKEYNIPTVDMYCEKPRLGIGQLHGDFKAIGLMAADFFLKRGYTNFGWCGIRGLVFSDETGQAFERRVQEAGHTVSTYNISEDERKIVIYSAPDHILDKRQLKKWLRLLPKPVAVFCCNDHRAYQVIRVALENGYSVPNDIAVLGIDNDSMICSFAPIPLSSIDPDAFLLGVSAARLLGSMLKGEVQMRSHRIHLSPPSRIVERQSSAFIPIKPVWLSNALLSIDRNLATGITASDIYSIAGLSSTSVERVFREKFNMPVISYIQMKRMEKATDLLRTTQMLTKEIAAAVGFASPQYFCRAFKDYHGMSPKEFSKNNHPASTRRRQS